MPSSWQTPAGAVKSCPQEGGCVVAFLGIQARENECSLEPTTTIVVTVSLLTSTTVFVC